MKVVLISEAVLLASAPVVAALVAFAFEMGVALYFAIPSRTISLSWTSVAFALVSVTGVYNLVGWWGYVLSTSLPRRLTVLTPKRVLIWTPMILTAGVLCL